MLPCRWCNGITRVVNTELHPEGQRRWLRCWDCGQLTRSLETYADNRVWEPLPDVTNHQPQGKRQGASNGRSVMTDDDISRLRQEAADGVPRAELAKRYGLTPNHITRIVNRRRWRHLA